jgi:hypothetical protein
MQLDEWSAKYEQDTEAKRVALEELKANQAKTLRQLQGVCICGPVVLSQNTYSLPDLTEQYNEYDKIVKQDAKRKKKMKEAAERSAAVLDCSEIGLT